VYCEVKANSVSKFA